MKYIIAILLALMSSTAYAADDYKGLHGNVPHALGGGITDDANQEFKYFRTTVEGYPKVSLGTALASGTDSIAVDFVSNATLNITTATTTTVLANNGAVSNIIVNTAGTNAGILLYNIASAGCTGTPASGYAFTIVATTAGVKGPINHIFPLGICAVTVGSPAADIAVLYKDLP